MVGIFDRSPNGDGNLQWRCREVMRNARMKHTFAMRSADSKETTVLCNIKRKPKVGAYCKAPAYYM